MRPKIRSLLIAVMSLALVTGSLVQPVSSAVHNTYILPSLKLAWATGILSDSAAYAGILVADLNDDGALDIASCNQGYVFILNATGSDSYDVTWYSSYLGCLKLTAGDRDADGVSELYLSTDTGKLVVIDADSHATLGSISLGGYNGKGIAVADVDDDDELEIVVTDVLVTLVYDATTYALEWKADNLGGYIVQVGQIDTDPLPEIVVGGNTSYVLNASTQSLEWSYSGFGNHLSLGDVDGDGRDEIAFIPYNDYTSVKVMDGDTQAIQWSVTSSMGFVDVKIADVDADGTGEVLIGGDYWSGVSGYQVGDSEPLWSISNPGLGVSNIAIGDVNEDGDNEILWGAGFSLQGQGLFIGSWLSQTVLWETDDLDGPLYVAAGDVDNDGRGEMVMVSYGTREDYGGGMIRVYDGATRQLEWFTLVNDSFNITHLAVGQLDADPALEILVGGIYLYETRLEAYDGASHDLQWTSESDSSMGALTSLAVKNVDADAVEEIFIGLSEARVIVLNGASQVIDWDSTSGEFDTPIIDLAVGDLDGDGDQDLALLTSQAVFILDTDGWTQTLFSGLWNGVQLEIAEADADGPGELLLVIANNETDVVLQGWDAQSLAVNRIQPLGSVTVKDLRSLDVDQDGVRELLLVGAEGDLTDHRSLLWIGSRSYPSFWETKLKGYWDIINSAALSDVDNDGKAELLLGAFNLIQLFEINTRSVNLQLAYLPFARKPCIPVPLYFDDFSDPYSGWPVIYAPEYIYDYVNGEYRMLLISKNWVGRARPAFVGDDYQLSVNLRNVNDVQGSYGLMFSIAADWSSYITLEIYPDGWYGIYRLYQGQWTVLAEAYSPAIFQGSASNLIKIVRSRDQIDAYANGQLLTTVYDSFLSGDRYTGLVVWSYEERNVDIRFDNFAVYPLVCGNDPVLDSASPAVQLAPQAQWLDPGLPGFELLAERRWHASP